MSSKSKDIIIINENNLATGIVHREHILIYSGFYWHKIYVQFANTYSREFVLRTLMKTVHPLDFIPVCYTIEGDNVCFLLKNCGAAIIELCRLNLTVAHPDPLLNLPPFKIAILLKHANANDMKIEIQSNIINILRKRYNYINKTLNLDSFYKDTELLEFCPLSQPKLMYFVLHLSREYDIEVLKLSNNDIELLKPLEALYNERCLKHLSCIDFSKNKITNVSELGMLKSFSLNELILDENPICEGLSESAYLKLVRTHCPKITKLDGCRVPPSGTLSLRRNYLCDSAGKDIIDQFLEHYFTLYDSNNRIILESVYHKNAMFSLTCHYLVNQSTSNGARLNDYKKISRNIKRITDFSKCSDYLFIGPSKIVNALIGLPLSEHDPYTFTIDLSYFTGKTAIFTVTGVFREPGASLLEAERVFGFTRTFVLMLGIDNEYTIVNEQLHVANATSSQHARAFKVSRVPKSNYIQIPTPKHTVDRDEIVDTFVAITHLRTEWARKCLEETSYDLKRGLNLFVSLFKVDKFPEYAFNVFEEVPQLQIPQMPLRTISQKTPLIAPAAPNISVYDPFSNPSAKEFDSGPSFTTPDNLIQLGQKKSKISVPLNKLTIPVPIPVPAPMVVPVPPIPVGPVVVTDPIILDALKLNENTPVNEVKPILRKAAKLILEKYTCAAKYYKAIGKEFYKFKLFTDARNFLAGGMLKMTKQLGEEVYSLFTLYEIQYGDLVVAENMIKITVLTYPINKTIRFIGEHVVKLNVNFARNMFIFSLNLPITFEKKVDIIKAFKSFELTHGTVALQDAAQEICEKIIKEADSDGLYDIFNDKAIVIEDSPKYNENSPTEIKASPKSILKASPITTPTPKDVKGNHIETRLTSPVVAIIPPQVEPIITIIDPFKATNDPTIAKTELVKEEPVAKKCINLYATPEFIAFRESAFIYLNILVKAPDCPEIESMRIHSGTDEELATIGSNILIKYDYNLCLLKEICLQYFERNMLDKMRKALADANIKSNDILLLNNLTVFFKIKSHLLANDITAARNMIQIHLKVCTAKQFIHFFENLNDLEQSFVRSTYIFSTKIPSLPFNFKLTGYLYKSYELRYGNEKTIIPARNSCKVGKNPYFISIPFTSSSIDEDSDIIINFRKSYEGVASHFKGHFAWSFKKKHKNSLYASIEAIRASLYHRMNSQAQQLYKHSLKGLNTIEANMLQLSYSLLEIEFGDKQIALDILKTFPCKPTKPHIEVNCITIEMLLKEKRINEIKEKLVVMIDNPIIMACPNVLSVLFKYNQRWITKYSYNMFDQ